MPQKRKEYANTLYDKKNIYAYTGNLNENPTVYFRYNFKDGRIGYGHITQAHDMKFSNVGREQWHISTSYEMVNKFDSKGKYLSHEYDYNRKPDTYIHKSRTRHYKVNQNDHTKIDILAEAIGKHKGRKKMDVAPYVKERLEIIREEHDLQSQVEMLKELSFEMDCIKIEKDRQYPNKKEWWAKENVYGKKKINLELDKVHEKIEYQNQQKKQVQKEIPIEKPQNFSPQKTVVQKPIQSNHNQQNNPQQNDTQQKKNTKKKRRVFSPPKNVVQQPLPSSNNQQNQPPQKENTKTKLRVFSQPKNAAMKPPSYGQPNSTNTQQHQNQSKKRKSGKKVTY